MRLARLSHEDSPAFLKDLGVNDPRTLPKTGYIVLAPDDRLDCFAVASTASRLQSGQSDRVRLGTPVLIGVRWRFFRSRPGAQLGAGSAPSGRTRLTELAMVHAALDAKRE